MGLKANTKISDIKIDKVLSEVVPMEELKT